MVTPAIGVKLIERLAVGATIKEGERTFERRNRMVREQTKEGAG